MWLPPETEIIRIGAAVLETVEGVVDVRTRPRSVNGVRIIHNPVSIKDITRIEVAYYIGVDVSWTLMGFFDCGE